MGVDLPTLQFLLKCRSALGEHKSCLTLGRQRLLLPINNYRRRFEQALKDYDAGLSLADIESDHIERLLQCLGFSEIHVMDTSPYEGAEVIHDLNKPIPRSLHQKYDVVLDVGTLEHVFNIPVAFANVGHMVREGGIFISVNQADNHLGHGFWQFSPEAYLRSFSEDNGFRPRLAYLHYAGKFHELRDPETAGRRLPLKTEGYTYICFASQRITCKTLFEDGWPTQSDYQASWIRFLARKAAAETGVEAEERILSDAFAANPRNPLYASSLSAVMRRSRRFAEADRLSQSAYQTAPDNPDIIFERVETLVAAGRPDEAIGIARDGVRLWPALWRLHSSLGNALRVAGKLRESAEAYRAALELSPTSPSLHRQLQAVEKLLEK